MRAATLLFLVIAIGCGGRSDPRNAAVGSSDDVAVGSSDTAVGSSDAAAVGSSDDVAVDSSDAVAVGSSDDVAVDSEGDAASDGSDGAWLPADVRARLDAGEGCVAVSASGRVVVSVVNGASGRLLRLVDLGWDRGGEGELSWPYEERRRAFADPTFQGALREAKLARCETVHGAPPMMLPTPVPIAVSADSERAELAIEGNRPARVSLKHGQWQVAGAYYLRDGGSVYLRLARASGERGSDDFALASVGAVELGQSRCVPRPRMGKPLAGGAPAFDPSPREVSCVAMTADGQSAAFKTWYKARGGARKDVPNAITWVGPGAASAVDLGCMARRCKPDEVERLRATTEGLIGCAPVKGAIALDGMLVPFVVSNGLVRLQGGSGWRTVFELEDGPVVHETLWKAFQHPAGGPVFLYVGRDEGDEAGEGAVVRVLDEASLGLCEPPPADALVVGEVVVSGALKDRSGYKLGGSQLIDGDPTTAWQPQPPAKGESAWAELVLDGEREVTGVEIANGFQRRDGNGDLFEAHARVAELVIAFPDGTNEKVVLAPDERGYRRIAFAPRRTTRVRLVIAGEHAGSGGSVAISEVRVIGR